MQSRSITPETPKARVFVTLDALRGCAALPVVCYHVSRQFGRHFWFRHGHLAVDFFFMLSGFVMAYVYGQRLHAGWSTGAFLRTRVLRLYPLFGLGILLGACAKLLPLQHGADHLSPGLWCGLLALNLLFLPAPPRPWLPRAPGTLYLFDFPAWSLLYELLANLLHAVVLRRRSPPVLAGLAAVLGVLLAVTSVRQGSLNYGTERTQLGIGLVRVLFSYITGMALHAAWRKGRARWSVPPALTAVLLVAVLMLPLPQRFSVVYDPVVVIAVFPLLLWAGAGTQPSARYLGLAGRLGALSYPVYILHIPLFWLFQQVWFSVTHRQSETAAPWSGLLFLLLAVPAAYVLGERYDPEARRLLHGWARPGTSMARAGVDG